MPDDSSFMDMDDEDIESALDQMKNITLTKNEALYLSDSITLLMEHEQTPGLVHMPARHLTAQASVPVPFELIQKIGIAVLIATDPENSSCEATIELSMADLYLLRECCQTYIRVNKELVGYNLIRKVYSLLLEDLLKEKHLVETLIETADEVDEAPYNIATFETIKDQYQIYLNQESEVTDERQH
tara:strand:- start:1719 stop:2276 length:558 start_codon:yes stop_codon:yes gene_type:complete